MHPLIALLDTLGRQPGADLDALLADPSLAPPAREALRARDPDALIRAFGAAADLWCITNVPEDQPQPAEDAPDDTPGDEPPDGSPERAPER